jgi:hypothetical protein
MKLLWGIIGWPLDKLAKPKRANGHKGPNIAGIDPVTKKLTKLFHPRRHKWDRHFRGQGPYIVGRTAVGRVTVAVLAMNDPEVIEVRAALLEEGIFPPPRGSARRKP